MGAVYGEWMIGSCSASCGVGERTDRRACLKGMCMQELVRKVPCNSGVACRPAPVVKPAPVVVVTPVRTATCQLPDLRSLNMVTPENVVFNQGDSLRLNCGFGYEMSGNDVITCQANGQFTEVKATCVLSYGGLRSYNSGRWARYRRN